LLQHLESETFASYTRSVPLGIMGARACQARLLLSARRLGFGVTWASLSVEFRMNRDGGRCGAAVASRRGELWTACARQGAARLPAHLCDA
jgi:hypothetical protein